MRRYLLAFCLVGLVAAAAAFAAPPANDDRANPVGLDLPARVAGTTFEATVDDSEPFGCESIRGSVWYSIPPGDERRIAVRVRAGGDLDALVEVFAATRSQLSSVACERTDEDGRGALTFRAAKDQRYLVRVSRRFNSVPGNFQLEVFSPQAPAVPPGARLPRAGVTLALDRLENTDDAFSARLTEGVSYRVNLGPRAERCIGLTLYPPGTTTFGEAADPVRARHCGGYFLFTPGPGEGGLYTLLVQSNDNRSGPQRYHLQVAPAGPDDSLPGRRLRRFTRGALRGGQIDAVDLYRFDVVRRSTVNLSLSAPDDTDDFDLQLKRQGGRRLECGCGEGGDEEIERRLRPGRYYVAVTTGPQHAGRYQLTRSVRTITSTRVRFNGRRKLSTRPGREVSIGTRVRPGVDGPVTVIVERFDPFFGFQFDRIYRTRAENGRAVVRFLPRAVGRYRATAAFAGTRSAAPSRSRRPVGLLVAGPLRP